MRSQPPNGPKLGPKSKRPPPHVFSAACLQLRSLAITPKLKSVFFHKFSINTNCTLQVLEKFNHAIYTKVELKSIYMMTRVHLARDVCRCGKTHATYLLLSEID